DVGAAHDVQRGRGGLAAGQPVRQVGQPIQVKAPGEQGQRPDREPGRRQRPGPEGLVGHEQDGRGDDAEQQAHGRRPRHGRARGGPRRAGAAIWPAIWAAIRAARRVAAGRGVVPGSPPWDHGEQRHRKPEPRSSHSEGAYRPRAERRTILIAGSVHIRDGGGRGVSEWWSIEVFDASELPARRWKDSYQDDLTEAALTNGAIEWAWDEHRYGVGVRGRLDSDEQWEAFRALPAVRSALDGVPDPVNGLIVYRGRGGGSGPRKPRKPRPAPGASAMALPEPVEEQILHLAGVAPPGRPEEA